MHAGGFAWMLLAATTAACISGPSPLGAGPPSPVPGPGLPADVVVVPGDAVFERVAADPAYPRSVQVLVGTPGGEPNIGVTSRGTIFATGNDYTMRSRDGAHTWDVAYDFNAHLPVPRDPFTSFDPNLWVDPDTDRVFTNHNYPALACTTTIVSDDDGNTWTHYPVSCGGTGGTVIDHQKISTARPRSPLVAPSYANIVYLCYNKVVSTNCMASYDGGQHYLTDAVVSPADPAGCGGTNGQPTPALDGTLYVPLGSGCGVPHVAVTQDNGLTWTVRRFGADVGSTYLDPEIAVTADGTAYYFNRGADGNGYLFRSRDGFRSVDNSWPVNPPDVRGVVFAGMVAGDDGALAIAYLGNREYAGDPSDAPPNVRWHLFVSTTWDADGGRPTFLTQQVTPPDDPVQVGCIWLRGLVNDCRNLLDFFDAAVGPDGRVYVVFADGCTAKDGCAGDADAAPAQSRDDALAVAVQDHGPGLRAAAGLLPSLNWTAQVNPAAPR